MKEVRNSRLGVPGTVIVVIEIAVVVAIAAVVPGVAAVVAVAIAAVVGLRMPGGGLVRAEGSYIH